MFHPKGPTFWELARQALSSTEKGYDLLAPKFDFTPFRTPDLVLEPALALIEEPVDAAVDLCCGTGAALHFMHPLCRNRLVGIDMSAGMLAEAEKIMAREADQIPVELVRGNVLDMPYRACFDLAVCFGALGHIVGRDQDTFLDQVRQILVPGGRFLFVTGDKPAIFSREYLFSKSFNMAMRVRNLLFPSTFIMYYLTFLLPEIKQSLQKHGFRVQVLDDVYNGPAASLKVVIATRPA